MADISIRSIVAARNEEPYVQIKVDHNEMIQLRVSEARSIATDILLSASRAEMDAALLKFWRTRNFPMDEIGPMMSDFRDFRLGMDLDKPVTSYGDSQNLTDYPHGPEGEDHG